MFIILVHSLYKQGKGGEKNRERERESINEKKKRKPTEVFSKNRQKYLVKRKGRKKLYLFLSFRAKTRERAENSLFVLPCSKRSVIDKI